MLILRYSLIAIAMLVSLGAAAVGGIRLSGWVSDGGSLLPVIVWGAVWVVSTAILVLELIHAGARRNPGGSLESIAEAMPVGFALLDSRNNLVVSNEIFRQTISDPALLRDGREELDIGPKGRIRLLHRQLADGGKLVVGIDMTREVELSNEKYEEIARLSQLVGAAADWIWETDILHRFTAAAKVDDDRACPKLDGMVGCNLMELAQDNTGMADWTTEDCLREMERHEPFQDRSLRLVLDGSIYAVRLSGVPRYDASGEFLGYHGVGKREAEAPQSEALVYVNRIPEETSAPGRLLLVDDSVTNRRLAETILKRMGYEVSSVDGGREAVEAVRTGGYAAVLMDIWMPEMDGFEATAKIRALKPPLCDIPVIAMTAHVGDEERRKCLEAGMNEHVGKPIDRAHLASVLREFVGPATGMLPETESDALIPPVQVGLVNDEVLNQLRTDAGPALVKELIEAYMAETDDRLARFASALKARNLDEIGADAHSMKSSSGTFGALQLQALAARIEAAAMAGDFDVLTDAGSELPELVSATWGAFAQRGYQRN